MMAFPRVTVLMTIYNRRQYVAAAIESVLAQTFTDFELVLVDDASTDDSVEIAQPYLADPRVRLIVNERNLGDYPNRNHAATFARGEFVKYHDSDDVMYPHCLDTMVRCLAAEPRAAMALTTSRPWPGGECPMLLTPRLAYLREYLGEGMFHLGPACALFRRQAFAELGGFPLMGVSSDVYFWISACSRVNVLLVPGDLFWYRVHEGQELQRGNAKYTTALMERHLWAAIDAPHSPLDRAEREDAKRNRASGILKRLIRDVRTGEWSVAWVRFHHSGLTIGDWIRYARRPRYVIEAGTPSNDDTAIPSIGS